MRDAFLKAFKANPNYMEELKAIHAIRFKTRLIPFGDFDNIRTFYGMAVAEPIKPQTYPHEERGLI